MSLNPTSIAEAHNVLNSIDVKTKQNENLNTSKLLEKLPKKRILSFEKK